MVKSLVLQIDAIETLNFKLDSSLYFAKEFQKNKYKIYYYTPENLSFKDGLVYANGYEIKLLDKAPFFKKLRKTKIMLDGVDVILIRQNPPFDMNYITATYILERVRKKVKIFNDPAAIRNNVEKLITYEFPKYTLPSLISFDEAELLAFFKKHKKVIVKPLYGFAGKDLQLIETEGALKRYTKSLIKEKINFVMQKFCPEVLTKGDKRVLFIGGEVVGVLDKKAAPNMIATNIAAGGTAMVSKLSAKEEKLCKEIGKYLVKNNIMLAGADIVGGYLLEVNITSPTMFKMYADMTGKKLSETFFNAVNH